MSPPQESDLVRPSAPYKSPRVAYIAGSGAIANAVAARLESGGWTTFRASRRSTGHDLRDFKQVQDSVAQCMRMHSNITVVITAAGEFEEASYGAVSTSYNPHLALIEQNVAKATAHILRRNREGTFLLLTTYLSRQTIDYPGLTKFLMWGSAVTSLYEGLMIELRQAHVRSCLLALGMVDSKFGRDVKRVLGNAINPKYATLLSPVDVARSVEFMIEPTTDGVLTEMVMAPQTMLERNQVFNDVPRVQQAVDKLIAENPDFRDGKVALVTGCGKGIGKGIALELVKAGYDLIGLTRTPGDLATLKEECEAVNPRARFLGIPTDVTNSKALEAAVVRGAREMGTLSLAVSNAGTNKRRVAALSTLDVWKQVLDVDLVAAMDLTRIALPWLLRHARLTRPAAGARATMMVVGTNYAHPKGVRLSGLTSYIASKCGSAAFCNVVNQEVRDLGVQVVNLSPGIVATDLGTRKNAAAKDGELIDSSMLIQPRDMGKIAVHAADGPVGVNYSDMYVECLYHGYPAVRNTHRKFVASLDASDARVSRGAAL